MSTKPSLYLFTTTQYERLAEVGILTGDEPVELIEGEILKMKPTSPGHAACISRLITIFAPYAGKTLILTVQTPICLSNYTETQPDALILRWRSDHYDEALPTSADVLLLMEVADVSLQYDQKIKLPLYSKAGIHEVWIANLPEEQIEIYTQPTDGVYHETHIVKRSESFTSPALPGLTLTAAMILG